MKAYLIPLLLLPLTGCATPPPINYKDIDISEGCEYTQGTELAALSPQGKEVNLETACWHKYTEETRLEPWEPLYQYQMIK